MKHLIIAVVICLASCGYGTKKIEPKKEEPQEETSITLTDEQVKNAGIVLGKAEQKSISSYLKVNGVIDVPPQNLASVCFQYGGYLYATHLLPGTQVRKGQPIAVIENHQFIQIQQDYLAAKARQNYLKQEYDRQRELNQSKATSDKVFQLAEAEYNSNEVALQANAEKLKQIGIVPEKLTHNNITSRVSLLSPITGVVSKVNINIGKYINPADVLFEIVNPSDIHLRLSVFEKDVNLLSIGQSVDAYPANNPAHKYKCEVILVNRDIAPDRSLEVHCHFKQPDTFLVPGMYMTADIEVNTQNAIVLPKEAIVAYGSQSYIFISVNKNKFEMLPVTTGVGENGYLQVIPPVGADILPKNIVIEHAYTLLMKVKNKGGEEE